MFKLLSGSNAGKTLFTGVLVITSMSVQAELTTYNSNGVDLVYSSVSDVTCTKDGNLLGSMIASNGFNTLVNEIIAASPIITNTPNGYSSYTNFSLDTDTSAYHISAFDFSATNGTTTWWGAVAFINYLNTINYGGSSQWHLPTAAYVGDDAYNTNTNGVLEGDELAELFYHELKAEQYYNIPDTITLENEVSAFWTSTELLANTKPIDKYQAWAFSNLYGLQFGGFKNYTYNAWAVSLGQIAAVPKPDSLLMLLTGLGMLSATARRTKQSQ